MEKHTHAFILVVSVLSLSLSVCFFTQMEHIGANFERLSVQERIIDF